MGAFPPSGGSRVKNTATSLPSDCLIGRARRSISRPACFYGLFRPARPFFVRAGRLSRRPIVPGLYCRAPPLALPGPFRPLVWPLARRGGGAVTLLPRRGRAGRQKNDAAGDAGDAEETGFPPSRAAGRGAGGLPGAGHANIVPNHGVKGGRCPPCGCGQGPPLYPIGFDKRTSSQVSNALPLGPCRPVALCRLGGGAGGLGLEAFDLFFLA